MWHASLALHAPISDRPLGITRWKPQDAAKARELAYHALRGVGDMRQEKWEYGEVALHLRRACTAAEIAALPPGTIERRIAMGLGVKP